MRATLPGLLFLILTASVLTAAEDAHVGAVNGADVGAAPTWTAAGTAQST